MHSEATWRRWWILGAAHLLLLNAVAPEASVSTWPAPRPPLTYSAKSLQNALLSIEERLSSLDSLWYSASRWELALDGVGRRLDALETKVGRLDTFVQLKLNKVAEAISSRELKDELANDHLTRKSETGYERLSHKIDFMETRIQTMLNKLQSSVEASLGRIEQRQIDMEVDVADMVSVLDEVKVHTAQTEDRINTTQRQIQAFTSISAKQDQLEKLSSSIDQFSVRLNESLGLLGSQNDASQSQDDKLIAVVQKTITDEANKLGNKVSNMYNELWESVSWIQSAMKNITSGEETKKKLQEELQSYLTDTQENFSEYFEIAIDALALTLQRNLSELSLKMDTSFEHIAFTQNVFMETCHRLQYDEEQIESKVSYILERILDTVTNRSLDMDGQLLAVIDRINTHNSQVMRTVGYTNNMLVKLNEESSLGNKQIAASVIELSKGLQELQQHVQDMFSNDDKHHADSHMTEEASTGTWTQSKIQTNKQKLKQEPPESEIGKEDKPELNVLAARYNEGVLSILTENILDESKNISVKSILERSDPNPIYINGLYNNERMRQASELALHIREILNRTNKVDEKLLTEMVNRTLNTHDIDDIIQNTQSNYQQSAMKNTSRNKLNLINSTENAVFNETEVNYILSQKNINEQESLHEKTSTMEENSAIDKNVDKSNSSAIYKEIDETLGNTNDTIWKSLVQGLKIIFPDRPALVSNTTKNAENDELDFKVFEASS